MGTKAEEIFLQTKQICRMCGGTGRLPDTNQHCHACNGTGKIDALISVLDFEQLTAKNKIQYEPGAGDILKLVLDDVKTRRLNGIQKYGSPLQIDNNDITLDELYYKTLDIAVYLRCKIEEEKIKNMSDDFITFKHTGND
jgi:hypothetical protein